MGGIVWQLAALVLAVILSGVGARPGAAQTRGTKNYSNATYGVSFQYPGNFAINEGKLPRNDVGLGYLGRIPMGFQDPGGVRVVTVENPEAYPGTPYVNSFFTVSVNRYETQGECGSFQLGPPYRDTAPVTIGGIRFVGVEGGGAATNHSLDSNYYHGFSDGTCYELGYGVATAGWVGPDSQTTVFPDKVFDILKNILHSTSIRPPSEPTRSPAIRSFSVTPLGKPFKPYTYRVSWDVARAEATQVFLTATWSNPQAEFPFSHFCFGKTVIDVFEVTTELMKGKPFGCDVILPLGATKGSVNLAFWNRTGKGAVQELRLFVRDSAPVTRKVDITLPSLPVIWLINGRYLMPNAAAPVYAGQAASVFGRFHGDETAWVGRTQARVKSHGRGKMWFVVPSVPPGRYALHVANERGRSNAMPLDISTTRKPRITFINGTNALPGPYFPTIYPGEPVVVSGVNLSGENTVWIGSTSLTVRASDRETLRFTAPMSLLSGDARAELRNWSRIPGFLPQVEKSFYLTNKYGRSNEVHVFIRIPQ